MPIEEPCELLERPGRTISREASNKGTFNDYPVREYTQASGSARHPERMMI